MPWTKNLVVGAVSGDASRSPADIVDVDDSVTRLVTAVRSAADAVGVTDVVGASVSSGTSTQAVFPNLTSHSGAVWNRSGYWLQSTGRRDVAVFDEAPGFTLGTTRPTWANSGSRIARASMTTNNTVNLVTTADGQVISGVYLPFGRIEVRHRNVRIVDCEIAIGWAPDGSGAGQRANIHANAGVICNPAYDCSGLIMEYVTIDPVNAGANGGANDWTTCGVYCLGKFAAYRCKMRDCDDGFMPDHQWSGPTPSHAAYFYGNYIETVWRAVDGEHDDGTHNDSVQVTGEDGDAFIGNASVASSGGVTDPGSGFTVQGNGFEISPYNSSDLVPNVNDASQVSNTFLWFNWFSGSYTQIASWTSAGEGGSGVPGLSIIGNRHGGTTVWPVLMTPASNLAKKAFTGSVADTGGCTWNNGTTAAGGSISANVASHPLDAGTNVTVATAYAGLNQQVEPGATVFLLGKGKAAPTQQDPGGAWIKTGTWAQVSGPAVTITTQTSSDGWTVASVVVPVSVSAQTIVMRYTPTGTSATDTTTLNVAPKQN